MLVLIHLIVMHLFWWQFLEWIDFDFKTLSTISIFSVNRILSLSIILYYSKIYACIYYYSAYFSVDKFIDMIILNIIQNIIKTTIFHISKDKGIKFCCSKFFNLIKLIKCTILCFLFWNASTIAINFMQSINICENNNKFS